MFRISGDPLADFDCHQREIEERLERYPICEECGEHIQDEKHYIIGDKHYCCECVEEVYTDDYVDED